MKARTVWTAFDPVVLGGAECDAWAAYYRREWPRALRAFVTMIDEGFRMGRRRTLIGAWHVLLANRAWAPYPYNDPDIARARMTRFYELAAATGRPGLDPARAAELDVHWWHVHRQRQRDARADFDALTDALAELSAYVYDVPVERVRAAAALRAEAMDVSDAWVAGGCSDDAQLAEERGLLVASYTTLHEAVHAR